MNLIMETFSNQTKLRKNVSKQNIDNIPLKITSKRVTSRCTSPLKPLLMNPPVRYFFKTDRKITIKIIKSNPDKIMIS